MPSRMREKQKNFYLVESMEEGQAFQMPNRMRVEGIYCFLDDSMEEGHAF